MESGTIHADTFAHPLDEHGAADHAPGEPARDRDEHAQRGALEPAPGEPAPHEPVPDEPVRDEPVRDEQEPDHDAAALATEARAPVAAPADVVEAVDTGFRDLGLSEPVLQAIAEMGYRIPTPIQAQAIPFVLMGRDVLGTAQTGTGKTASFTLPMLDILAGSRARARMPRSLILEPTRELALQVAENFVQYGKHLKLTHALIIGGESVSDQKEVLMRGVDVLIATPGRLLDMFERGGILLSDAKLLVIDEADRMLDMGFIPDVERIVGLLPRTRQTLFFSATMAPEIRRLADAFLQNPKEIAVSRPASVATTITEELALVAEIDKREALRRLLRAGAVQNALIFCNRKRDVDILYKSLNKHGFSVGALHGDLAQSVRFATLEKFKAGDLRLLVCSDVAARGIDIGGLSHVFNFDVPQHPEDYVHRIGRTGRAGLQGHAYTLATPDERYAVAAIEKLTGKPIPMIAIDGLDPVAWSEDDGKPRRRGARGRAPAPDRRRPASPPAARRPAEEPGEAPGRSRRETAAAPRAHRPAEARTTEARGTEPRPAGPRRTEARPVEARPTEARRPDGRQADGRQGDGWQSGGRGGRAEHGAATTAAQAAESGPVLGFGNDVPAFMLIKPRKAARPAEPVQDQAGTYAVMDEEDAA